MNAKLPSEDQIKLAGFPAELQALVANGTLSFSSAYDNGSLCFHVPSKDESRTATYLTWHPENQETWTYEGLRFYVETEFYHDRKQYSMAGSELEADLDTIEQLIDWLEED